MNLIVISFIILKLAFNKTHSEGVCLVSEATKYSLWYV